MNGSTRSFRDLIKMLQKCRICDKEANSYCTGCFAVAYCGKDHQKEDWKLHKKSCIKAYTVRDDPVAGRVMVAHSSSKPLCVSCFKSTSKTFVHCSKCSLPLCSQKCQGNPLHAAECRTLSQNKEAIFSSYSKRSVAKRKKIPINVNYQVILVLRGLLLEDKQLESIMSLQSHLEERQQMGKTKIVDDSIIPIINQFRIKDANEEKIHNLCGIFDTNCFELFPTGAGDTISGVFPNAAMMMHSCYKNTRVMFSDDHMMTLIARSKIKKGDNIYHNYARTFNPTNIRRIGLFSGKHFSCECVRCKNPTELNTFMSVFLCPCSGQIIPKDPLDLTPTAVSMCNKCKKSTPSLQLAAKERELLMELENIDRLDIKAHEQFLIKNNKILHVNHAFMLKIKKELSVAYGGYPGYNIQTITDDRLELKEKYCEEIISICNVLEPGLSTQKGLSLFELWKARSEINKRNFSKKLLSSEEYSSNIKKNVDILERSLRIMEYEPENSLHGVLVKEIKKLIKQEKSY